MRTGVLAFALGVLLLQTRAELPTLWTAAIVPALFALALALRGQSNAVKHSRRAAWLLVAFVGGYYWAAGHASMRIAVFDSALEGADLRVVGVVATLPQITERGGRFVFDIERTIAPAVTAPHQVLLNWYRMENAAAPAEKAVAPAFRPGERWQLTVRLRRPHGTANPHGFDFELWAMERDIGATGAIREDSDNRRLDALVLKPGYLVERIRAAIRERFDAVLANAPYRAVLTALAIGDQSGIPREQWKTFWRTGVGHLVSISGLHITMVAALVAGLTGWIWRRTSASLFLPAIKAAALSGFVAALVYSLLAGFSIPTQRTLYMLAVAAVALWSDRLASPSRVLALALLTVLLIDPWAVLAAGFWLSFGAVAVILYVASTRRSAGGWFASAVRAQVAVSLGLAPPLLGLFQQVSLVSPLANALAIPLVSLVIVPLTLLAAAVPVDALLHLAHALTGWAMTLLDALAASPQAAWESHAPPLWAVLLAIIGVLWLLSPRGIPARWLGALWLLPLLFVLPQRPSPGAVWLTVLDVGQGLAALVQTNQHALLYDTGPGYGADSDSGSRIVVPHLRASGIRRLAGLTVSHSDNDHSGGAVSVLDSAAVDWLLSSLAEDALIVAHAARAIRCHAGQRWEWDGVVFEVLHPALSAYAESGRKANDLSCVVKVTAAHGALLLTGDIEALSEAELLRRSSARLAADVLLAPHHGSLSSSTVAFVAAVKPSLVLFTTGYRNPFGHPRPEVVRRYEALPARLLQSDRDGAIFVTVDDGGVAASTWRQTARRYWWANY